MTDKVYSEKEARDLNKAEQIEILKNRGIEEIGRIESIRVNQILETNPKPKAESTILKEKNKEIIKCERCGKEMEITGGGPLGSKDYYCNPNNGGCGLRTTIGG